MILATASGVTDVEPTKLEWLVHRTVTDKLQRALRALSREGWLITPAFQGGRDWTLVCCRETEPARVPSSFPQPSGRSGAQSGDEVTGL